ncbi:MAG: glycosyltransferase family 2 protein [Miltoncostaeaceae bacterium]
MKLLAIVPAYNEEGAVGDVVREIRQEWPDGEVVVIDDGSGDATSQVAALAGARVVRLPFNLGIGGAVQTGYRIAWDEGFDVAVQIDGDGQHRPDQLPKLIARLTDGPENLVVGTRFVAEDASGFRSSRSRRGGIKILSWLVSRIVGHRVTDTTSGFRAADRLAIELFAAHYPHDYPEVEAIVMAARGGLQVAEVPVSMRARAAGESSITPVRSAYYMVKVLLAIGVLCIGRRPGRDGAGA